MSNNLKYNNYEKFNLDNVIKNEIDHNIGVYFDSFFYENLVENINSSINSKITNAIKNKVDFMKNDLKTKNSINQINKNKELEKVITIDQEDSDSTEDDTNNFIKDNDVPISESESKTVESEKNNNESEILEYKNEKDNLDSKNEKDNLESKNEKDNLDSKNEKDNLESKNENSNSVNDIDNKIEKVTDENRKLPGDIDKFIKIDEYFKTQILYKYNISRINDSHKKYINKISNNKLHYLIDRNIIFAQKNFTKIIDIHKNNNEFYIYLKIDIDDNFKLDDLLPLILSKYLQKVFNVPVFIQLINNKNDLSQNNIDTDNKQNKYNEFNNKKLTIKKYKDILSIGLDPRHTFVISNPTQYFEIDNEFDKENIKYLPLLSQNLHLFKSMEQVQCLYISRNDENDDIDKYMNSEVLCKRNIQSPSILYINKIGEEIGILSDNLMNEININNNINAIANKINENIVKSNDILLKEFNNVPNNIYNNQILNLYNFNSFIYLKYFIVNNDQFNDCLNNHFLENNMDDINNLFIKSILTLINNYQERRKNLSDELLINFINEEF